VAVGAAVALHQRTAAADTQASTVECRRGQQQQQTTTVGIVSRRCCQEVKACSNGCSSYLFSMLLVPSRLPNPALLLPHCPAIETSWFIDQW
jgi:hypothetical protein